MAKARELMRRYLFPMPRLILLAPYAESRLGKGLSSFAPIAFSNDGAILARGWRCFFRSKLC